MDLTSGSTVDPGVAADYEATKSTSLSAKLEAPSSSKTVPNTPAITMATGKFQSVKYQISA